MRTYLLLFSASLTYVAAPAAAARLLVSVDGVTPAQAVLRVHTATPVSSCTYRIGESPSMIPLANDVNPALFPGSDLDSRPGASIFGTQHIFVAGTRTSQRAPDGKMYSRALQANTTYYYSVSCGRDQASGTFTTANPPLGNAAPDLAPFDTSGFLRAIVVSDGGSGYSSAPTVIVTGDAQPPPKLLAQVSAGRVTGVTIVSAGGSYSDTPVVTFSGGGGSGAAAHANLASQSFGGYAWPTIDWRDPSKEYIDPLTGILLKRATLPAASPDDVMQVNSASVVADGAAAFSSGTSCQGAHWTNPCAALTADGNAATYDGAGGDPLGFVFSLRSYRGGTWESYERSMNEFQAQVLGSGSAASPADRTVSVCLTGHVYTGTCDTSWFDIVLPEGTAAPVSYPADHAFPGYGVLSDWVDASHPLPPNRDSYEHILDNALVSGNAMRWYSASPQNAGLPSFFDVGWKPGDRIGVRRLRSRLPVQQLHDRPGSRRPQPDTGTEPGQLPGRPGHPV